MFYLYVLRTTKCNKVYVGITTNPKRRERQHKQVAKHKWKTLTACGRAVKRYGAESFSLVIKGKFKTRAEAAIEEEIWIDRFGPKRTWNMNSGGYKTK